MLRDPAFFRRPNNIASRGRGGREESVGYEVPKKCPQICIFLSSFVQDGSNAQRTTERIVQWSLENRVQLNTDKCKEMRISFTKSQQEFEPILINGDALEVVDSVKLLGINISSDLTWNIHFTEIC